LSESPRTPRVLVVDDTEEMRKTIRRALSAGGYQVDVAGTLAEAEAKEPGGYDAVLVDAQLDGESGIDLVERLRSKDRVAAARCVLISGGIPDRLPEGTAYLAKPFSIEDLLEAVREAGRPRPGPWPLVRPDPARPAEPIAGRSPLSERAPAGDGPAGGGPAGAGPAGAGPAGGEPPAWLLLAMDRQLRARKQRALAAYLHNGPLQEIFAASLELQLLHRSHPALPPGFFDRVFPRLDAAAAALDRLPGGFPAETGPLDRLPGGFPAETGPVAGVLERRTAWLLAGPLTVDAGAGNQGLHAAEIPVVADVIELTLLGTVPEGCRARASAAVRADGRLIRIELTITPAADDAYEIGDVELARAGLARVAAALAAKASGDLRARCWRLRITLPRNHPESTDVRVNGLTPLIRARLVRARLVRARLARAPLAGRCCPRRHCPPAPGSPWPAARPG
jgi:CheY-like chemotaxis protein